MYDVPLFGNPLKGRTGRPKSSKKPKKKGKNTMSKKGKKKGKSRNPLGLSISSIKGPVLQGAAMGAGILLAETLVNHLPIPASLQGGIGDAAVRTAVGFALHIGAKKVKFLAPYADSLRAGPIALAFYKALAPTLLPALSFTPTAKAKAALDVQGINLIAMTKAAQDNAQTQGTNGVGDAFVMSRGGLSTADRAPRDTAALAGIGDAYSAERPGFSGAPNRLSHPWGQSIYARG